MLPKNDETCGWINDLPSRTNIKTISGKSSYDWIVVGAGFTGLSAARQLGKLHPNKKITIVDAQLAGEGASSRNSGYLVDTTLNDGFISNKSLNGFKEKNELYCLGIDSVKNFISQYQVDCDWNECGKYFASSKLSDEKKLVKFSEMLSSLNIENSVFYNHDLTARLGTNFYNIAVYTEGGILLHPGKLVRAMVDSLPENVTLFENSPLLKWEKNSGTINCKFNNGEISASSIIFCTNGFLSSLGIENAKDSNYANSKLKGEKNIRVNCLSPSGVYNDHPEEFVKKLSNIIPLGRMADINEYKGAIVFLCSDASSYMTGENIVIDGGKTVW